MADTIFTKIINRDIPADIVYEDETMIAFLDIEPINKGHVLVVPKDPFVNIFDGDGDALAQMMRVAHKLGKAIKEAVGADGINLLMNNVVGQEVPHAHLHVVPRYKNENKITISNKDSYAEGEAQQIATQILGALDE